jgi:murein DD-endopeptidase MepM/ murein hydrolase activator NlpD
LDEPHDGVDFAVPEEAAIRASRSGKVIFVGLSSAYAGRKDKKEKNRLVIIRHDDGLTTRYVHIEHLHVQPGKQVAAGDILGTVADSDEWPGTVVHFEIRDPNGRALDPQPLFAEPPKTAAR